MNNVPTAAAYCQVGSSNKEGGVDGMEDHAWVLENVEKERNGEAQH